MAGGCAWQRGHKWQGVCVAEGACVVEACMAGGGMHVWWGGGTHGRRDGHCSGRYVSYWNAFLLHLRLVELLLLRLRG